MKEVGKFMTLEKTLFENKSPKVYEIYVKILGLLEEIGPFEVEVKKTSIHLVNRAAFGGVHPKKNWLDFNLVTNLQVEHEKITKAEQVSKNRVHNNFRFQTLEELDHAFFILLKESYELMG